MPNSRPRSTCCRASPTARCTRPKPPGATASAARASRRCCRRCASRVADAARAAPGSRFRRRRKGPAASFRVVQGACVMSVIQVGLVDKTGKLDPDLVQSAAAALNIQVTRDLQFWPAVHATVIFLPNHKKTPSGVWPVQLVANLPAGEGGYHLDKHNQPYANVLAQAGSDGWTVAASHEILEMLVDPFGNRLQTSRSIRIVNGKIQDGPSEFAYLVEACDPCEADRYGYSIQGIAVSDFLTPRFYDPLPTPGTRYSF